MNRSTFAGMLGAAAAGIPLSAFARRLEGAVTTQSTLFGSLPRIAAGDWTRIILGSGAEYQKQIGAGVEHGPGGARLLFIETQVGSPGGSCNPSSMRKAYLRTHRFGSLLDTYPLVANIGRTENMVYRFGDAGDPGHVPTSDDRLRLLDEAYLYDPRPIRIVSVSAQMIHAASRNVDATHVVAEFTPARTGASGRMQRIELWHHAAFPFGVVRYRATLTELDPFVAHVYSFGTEVRIALRALAGAGARDDAQRPIRPASARHRRRQLLAGIGPLDAARIHGVCGCAASRGGVRDAPKPWWRRRLLFAGGPGQAAEGDSRWASSERRRSMRSGLLR